MFRPTLLISAVLLISFDLAGCSTAQIAIPLPKVAVDLATPQRSEKILLVISDDLSSAYHESSQLMSVFQYELGDYLPLAIKDSLGAQFAQVDMVSSESTPGQYDLIVAPELVSFDAPVPATVFSRTKVQLEIAYHLTMPQAAEGRVVSARGDYNFRSKDDETYYNSINTSVPDIYYYDVSSGVGAPIPSYTGIAGKDVAIAVKQCLEALNIKVVNALTDSE